MHGNIPHARTYTRTYTHTHRAAGPPDMEISLQTWNANTHRHMTHPLTSSTTKGFQRVVRNLQAKAECS